MKVAFGGTSVSREHEGASASLVQFFGKGNPVGKAQLRTEVADHAHNAMLGASKVKASVTAFGEAVILPLELREKPVQWARFVW